MNTALATALLVSSLISAEMRVQRDIAYATDAGRQQLLDVYSPTTGGAHPIVVWIHGGGWRQGDKALVQRKPQALVDRGWVFVSVNYRLVPQVTVQQMTGDIAKSIKWVHAHAAEYGGNPDKIFVAGHSAGAHLAALVCTDDRYLKAEGLPLPAIKGCIPVDTAAYDAREKVRSVGPLMAGRNAEIFGRDEAAQKELSPVSHVAANKGIPPFLILHVASRADSRSQSEAFAKALHDAGVEARVVAAAGKTHGTINSDLGLPDDEPTKAVYDFLDRLTKQP
jgi:acetyl esterase/lipase